MANKNDRVTHQYSIAKHFHKNGLLLEIQSIFYKKKQITIELSEFIENNFRTKVKKMSKIMKRTVNYITANYMLLYSSHYVNYIAVILKFRCYWMPSRKYYFIENDDI